MQQAAGVHSLGTPSRNAAHLELAIAVGKDVLGLEIPVEHLGCMDGQCAPSASAVLAYHGEVVAQAPASLCLHLCECTSGRAAFGTGRTGGAPV
jgi:hypothetical protein